LVVGLDCDSNFIATMVFTNSVVTSIGRKRMHVLYFLVTSIHCNMFMHGSIFVVHHHVKLPKAILCKLLILDCMKLIPF
jgi:hypothetical protein